LYVYTHILNQYIYIYIYVETYRFGYEDILMNANNLHMHTKKRALTCIHVSACYAMWACTCTHKHTILRFYRLATDELLASSMRLSAPLIYEVNASMLGDEPTRRARAEAPRALPASRRALREQEEISPATRVGHAMAATGSQVFHKFTSL
jgi:hypothetical protein